MPKIEIFNALFGLMERNIMEYSGWDCPILSDKRVYLRFDSLPLYFLFIIIIIIIIIMCIKCQKL
jgi:hypothetical protein